MMMMPMMGGGSSPSGGNAMMFRVAPPNLTSPTFSGIKLPKTTAGIKDFISQGRMMPQLQRTVASANLADAMLMESVAPGMVAATQAYGDRKSVV